jgi:hypothetical protein
MADLVSSVQIHELLQHPEGLLVERERTAASFTVDGLVRSNTDLSTTGDRTRDNNSQRTLTLSSFCQAGKVSDSNSVTTSTTSGAPILGTVTDGAALHSLTTSQLVASLAELGRRSNGHSGQEEKSGKPHFEGVKRE